MTCKYLPWQFNTVHEIYTCVHNMSAIKMCHCRVQLALFFFLTLRHSLQLNFLTAPTTLCNSPYPFPKSWSSASFFVAKTLLPSNKYRSWPATRLSMHACASLQLRSVTPAPARRVDNKHSKKCGVYFL